MFITNSAQLILDALGFLIRLLNRGLELIEALHDCIYSLARLLLRSNFGIEAAGNLFGSAVSGTMVALGTVGTPIHANNSFVDASHFASPYVKIGPTSGSISIMQRGI